MAGRVRLVAIQKMYQVLLALACCIPARMQEHLWAFLVKYNQALMAAFRRVANSKRALNSETQFRPVSGPVWPPLIGLQRNIVMFFPRIFQLLAAQQL